MGLWSNWSDGTKWLMGIVGALVVAAIIALAKQPPSDVLPGPSPTPADPTPTVIPVPTEAPIDIAVNEKREAGKAAAKGQQASTFPCEKSHAGNSGIKCEMTLNNSGLSWKFIETFNREVSVPWNAIGSWKAYGEFYGYALDINVNNPREGGGTFRFSSADWDAVIRLLRRYAQEKEE